MLNQWIGRLPKTVLAMIAILIGFFVIYQADPPRTLCDAQLDQFKAAQGDFLYGPGEDSKSKRPAVFNRLYANCEESSSPGGCFELLLRLKRMNQDLELVPKKCSDVVAGDSLLKKSIFKCMKLMAKISWGDRGPASVTRRNGWFDESDLSIYCSMHRHSTNFFGIEELDTWREETLSALPESNKMDRDSAFQKSLLSMSCDGYR